MNREDPMDGNGGYTQDNRGHGNYYGLTDNNENHGNLGSGTDLGKHYSSHFNVTINFIVYIYIF